jgi:hypothetical protein
VQRDELCGTSSLCFVDDTSPKQLKKIKTEHVLAVDI